MYIILLVIQKMVEDAENEWIEQLKTKDEQINNTRSKYNQNSRQLIEAQRTMQWCRSQERECDETETKIKFLEAVLRGERDENQEDFVLRKRQKLTHSNGNDSSSIQSSTSSAAISSSVTPIESTDSIKSTTAAAADSSFNDVASTSALTTTTSLTQSRLPEIVITPPNEPVPPPSVQNHSIAPATMVSRSASDEMIDGEIRSLHAQITAYIRDQELLKQEIASLSANTDRSEMQYKGIIASCCKLDIDKVDDFVESIISAI
jgi:hypothetical protein